MRGINQVHYIGSVTQAPDMKYTPGGLAILEVTVAGKQQIVTADGTAKTVSFYNRCKAFGAYAEALAESLQQGDVVSVYGRLDFRSYEGDGGQKRPTVETVITTLQTLEGKFVTTDDSRGQPVLLDGLNSVTIGGNLTKDAELRHTPTGNSVAHLNVAVNERFRRLQPSVGDCSDDGEKVGFFDLQGWGELAEALGNGSKGQGVVGVGRLLNESWEKDGQKRYSTKVELERGYFVSSGTSKNAPAKSAMTPRRTGERANPPTSVEEEFPPEAELPF